MAVEARKALFAAPAFDTAEALNAPRAAPPPYPDDGPGPKVLEMQVALKNMDDRLKLATSRSTGTRPSWRTPNGHGWTPAPTRKPSWHNSTSNGRRSLSQSACARPSLHNIK